MVAQALVPDAANTWAGRSWTSRCREKPTSGVPEKVSFHQLGLIGGDLHAEVHVDCQLLRGERSAVQSLINDNRPSCSRATTGLPVQLWHKRDARSNGEDVAAVTADEVAQAGGSGMD